MSAHADVGLPAPVGMHSPTGQPQTPEQWVLSCAGKQELVMAAMGMMVAMTVPKTLHPTEVLAKVAVMPDCIQGELLGQQDCIICHRMST